MQKFISYCVFAHFSLILVFANLMETAKDSWRAIRPSTALGSGLKPCCCSQNIRGPPWHLWEAHDAARTPANFRRFCTCPYGFIEPHGCTYDTSKFHPIYMWPDGSARTTVSRFSWSRVQAPCVSCISWFSKDNLKQQGSGLPSGRAQYLAGDATSRSWLLGHSIWALQRKPHPASWATCCSIS